MLYLSCKRNHTHRGSIDLSNTMTITVRLHKPDWNVSKMLKSNEWHKLIKFIRLIKITCKKIFENWFQSEKKSIHYLFCFLMLQIYYVCKTNNRLVFYYIDFTLHSVTDLKCKIWLNLISCLTLFQLYLRPKRTVSKLFFLRHPKANSRFVVCANIQKLW